MIGPDKKLLGLCRYHTSRLLQTRRKLLEALDRMEKGRTVTVGTDFSWNKTVLAREAGVNVNTLVRKLPDGEWAFPEVNERFEELKRKRQPVAGISDPKDAKIFDLRGEVDRLREQNRQLAREVGRIGRLVLEERDRADRMSAFERQNASLREEISRIRRADADGGERQA